MIFKKENLLISSFIAIVFLIYIFGIYSFGSNDVVAQTSPTPTPTRTPPPSSTPTPAPGIVDTFVPTKYVTGGSLAVGVPPPDNTSYGIGIFSGGMGVNTSVSAAIGAYFYASSGTPPYNYGRVGIGINPTDTSRLLVVNGDTEVNGNFKADSYTTGDIIMQKDGQPLWRMFEEPDGIYLESLITGKVFKISMQEVSK